MLYRDIQPELKPLFNAVGCICLLRGKVLLLRRVADKSYPGYWGTPSGKLRDGETPIKGMIRELFEETGLLLSQDNLREIHTFHVVNADMNFLYTLFSTSFSSSPKIKLNPTEHTSFDWLAPENALRLELVPDVDACLREVFPPHQLPLFKDYDPLSSFEIASIERSVREHDPQPSQAENKRNILVTLGVPGVGKSTFLKNLARKTRRPVVADMSWKKAGSNLGMYLKGAFQEGRTEFFFPFQMESLLTRFSYSVAAVESALIDESIYTTLAYSRALFRLQWIQSYEYLAFFRYYHLLNSLLPYPREVVYLECDLTEVKRRLAKRARPHEKWYTDNYLNTLHFAFEEIVREMRQMDIKVSCLNSTNTSSHKLATSYVTSQGD